MEGKRLQDSRCSGGAMTPPRPEVVLSDILLAVGYVPSKGGYEAALKVVAALLARLPTPHYSSIEANRLAHHERAEKDEARVRELEQRLPTPPATGQEAPAGAREKLRQAIQGAHWIDLSVRRGGKNEHSEADYLKEFLPETSASAAQPAPGAEGA